MALYEVHLLFDDGVRDEENVQVTFMRNDEEVFDVYVSRADEDDEFEDAGHDRTDIVLDENVLSDLAATFIKAVKAVKEAY